MKDDNDHSWLVPKGFVPPVEVDVRICFGIAWFEKEEDADRYAEEVVRKGLTYNGGWYHGMACGRDKSWDGKHGFAVTF